MGEPAEIAWRRRGTRPRRVVLLVDVSGSMSGYADALLRLAHRFRSRRGRRRARVEVFTVGTRLTHVTRAMRLRDPERAHRRGRRDGARLVRRHPAGRDAADLPRPLGAARDGPRRGRRGLQRRLGARRPRPARPSRWRGCTGSPTGSSGSTRTAARPATSRCSRASSRRCRTRRLRRRPLAGDLRRADRRWSPVREVLPELMAGGEAGETVGVGTVVATFRSAPRPPGASMLVGPDGEAVGSVSGGCVEGAVYELAQEVVESGTPGPQRYGVSDDDAFAVGLTCGGILDVYVEKVDRETFPELGEIAADIEAGRPVAVATVIEHPDPAWLGRRLVVRPERSPDDGSTEPDRLSGIAGPQRADDAVADDALGLLAAGPQRDADLRPRRRAARRGHAGLRVGVRAQAADAGLRRHRLRGRRRPGRQLPRLPRDGLRRPAGVRDHQPLPRGRRGRRRLAAPLPRRRGGGRPDRRAHGAVRAHPRPEVRRAAARGGAAAARGRPTSARWARGAPTTTGWSGCARPA